MTDLTDQDRRLALRWCDMLGDSTLHKEAAATRRVILATVDAPEPTLEDELRHIAEYWEEWETDTITSAIRAAADRAEQVEKERDEARAEVERLTAANEELRRTDNYREFKEFLSVQKGAESNAETPDPADVPPGEVWKANIWYEDKRHPGTAIKSSGGDWTVTRADGSRTTYRLNEYVELVSRLVPAPRVITDAKELLSGFSEGTIIRDKTGDIMFRDYDGWTEVNSDEWFVSLPATVLWEPEN